MIIADYAAITFRNGGFISYREITKFWIEIPVLIIVGKRNDGTQIDIESRHYLDQIKNLVVDFKYPIVLTKPTEYPNDSIRIHKSQE